MLRSCVSNLTLNVLLFLRKFRSSEPSFNYDGQSDPDLHTYLTEIKTKAAEDAKYQKKRDTLIKKFTDKFPTEECPTDMTNDDLDAHIKSKLDTQKKNKADKKKQDAKALRDANLVSKLSQQITSLPIPEGASVEDLKTLIKQQKTIAQEHKRELPIVISLENSMTLFVNKIHTLVSLLFH